MTAEEVRRWQERLGWTAERIAEELGVSAVTWSRWRNGRHEPPPFLELALRWLEHEEANADD